MSLTREEMYLRLDLRLEDPDPELATRSDAEIWRDAGAMSALLVMDLSGFTRITRARGILHFLTVYRRAMRIVVPAITRAGGRVVKHEADNVIATFPTPEAALSAARESLTECAALDASLGELDRVQPCFGIGYGKILELVDDVFGDEVNVTFKLGEDVAKRREILLTAGANAALPEALRITGEPQSIDLGGVTVPYFRA